MYFIPFVGKTHHKRNTAMRKFLFFGLIFLTFSQISAQQPGSNQAFFLTCLLPDSVQLNGAKGLSVDLSGNIYVADTGSNEALNILLHKKSLIQSAGNISQSCTQYFSVFCLFFAWQIECFLLYYYFKTFSLQFLLS